MTRRASLNASDDEGVAQIFLAPGTLHCAPVPSAITTVLGSCVAICLWDSRRRVGGMNHYVLPGRAASDRSARYGAFSSRRLLAGMIDLGCRAELLEAKIFGGAAVLSGGVEEKSVGAQNVAFALQFLAEREIPVIGRRTGGKRGLWIRQTTETGEVLVRTVNAEARRI